MCPNFFNFFANNTGYDILSWDGSGPIFGFFFALVKDIFNSEKWEDIFGGGKNRCISGK